MAKNEIAKDKDYNPMETVTVRLFKDNSKYKDPVFVGINGKNYLIERGKEVEVPRCVSEVLKNSLAQDDFANAVIAETSARFTDIIGEI